MTSTADPSPPAGPGWRLALGILRRAPQGLLSRLTGSLADIPLPRSLRRPVLGAFARLTGIDVSEAELPLDRYASVNAFFVRRLKPGARRWPTDPRAVASPVDGVLGEVGPLTSGRILQAKGREYSAVELTDDPGLVDRLEGGAFVTLYLSPRHYHRIHAPASGAVVAARHVPGRLLPVNRAAVRHVEDLFPRNERLVAVLESGGEPMALVAVGAFNVGRISTAFDDAWSGRDGGWITNRRHPPPSERRYEPGRPVSVGDEIMAFHLGSTVVLLLPPGTGLEPDARPGREVRAGTVLARRG